MCGCQSMTLKFACPAPILRQGCDQIFQRGPFTDCVRQCHCQPQETKNFVAMFHGIHNSARVVVRGDLLKYSIRNETFNTVTMLRESLPKNDIKVTAEVIGQFFLVV